MGCECKRVEVTCERLGTVPFTPADGILPNRWHPLFSSVVLYMNLAIGCLFFVQRGTQAEEWIDSTGKFKVEAELVDFDDQNVRLTRDADGKVITVHLARLSAANQEYLESLGSPADYRAIKDLCVEIRRTWHDTPSVDTAWPGDFVFFAHDLLTHEPKILDWDQTVEAAAQFRGPGAAFEEVTPVKSPASWQAKGPLALIHLPLARVRKGDNWFPIDLLLVAVRRQDKWRVASSMLGDWRAGADDVFDPNREDHQAIRDCYRQATRGLEAGDADLVFGNHHPSFRFYLTQSPDRLTLHRRDGLREASAQSLAAQPVKENVYQFHHVKRQGPLALVIGDVQRTFEDGEKTSYVGVDFLCQTEDGWRLVLTPWGDWRRILLREQPPAPEPDIDMPEPGAAGDKASVRQLCDRVRKAFADKDHEALLQDIWQDGFLAIANNRTPWSFEEFAQSFHNFPSAPTEIRLLEESPIIQLDGPIAMVHLPAYQLKHPAATENVHALAIAAKRDGQWQFAAMLFGQWAFPADEKFDPNKTDHREIQEVLDQIGQADEKNQPELLAPLYHPKWRLIGSTGPQAESAVLFSREEGLRNVAEAWGKMESLHYRHRIHKIHVRQDVALVQTQRWVEIDGKTVDSFLLFLFCRSGSGWDLVLTVTGDWREFLKGDTRSKDEPREAGSSQSDPGSGNPAWRESGDEEVTLQFKFTPGERITYHEAATSVQSADGRDCEISSSWFKAVQIASVSESGVAELRASYRSELRKWVGHHPLPRPVRGRSRFTISPRGRMEAITGFEDVTSLPSFPKHPVKLGETWQAPVGIAWSPMDVTYTLDGLGQVNGNTWARIAFRGEGEFAEHERKGKQLGVKPIIVANRSSQRVVVDRVTPGSAADEAGLLPGDILLELAERPLGALCDLFSAVDLSPPDEPVPAVIVRGGVKKKIVCTPRIVGSVPRATNGSIEGMLVFDVSRGKLIRRQIDHLAVRIVNPALTVNDTMRTTEHASDAEIPLNADVAAIDALVEKIDRAWAAEDGTELFGEILSRKAFAVPFLRPHLPNGVAVLDREQFLHHQLATRQGANFREHTHHADSITVIGPMGYEFGVTTHITTDGKTNVTKLLNCYALDESDWKLICSLSAEHVIKVVTASEDVAAQNDTEAVAAMRDMAEKFNRAWQTDDGIDQLGDCFSDTAFAYAVRDPKWYEALVLDKQATLDFFREQRSASGWTMELEFDKVMTLGPLAYAIGTVQQSAGDRAIHNWQLMSVFAKEPDGWKAIFCTSCDHIELAIPSDENG